MNYPSNTLITLGSPDLPARSLRISTPKNASRLGIGAPIHIEFPSSGEVRVRRIISRSAPRPVTKYPSVRMGRSIHCESSLEVDAAELLDACAQVQRFGEQPAIISYTTATGPNRHIPDFLMRVGHERVFVEVKFSKDVTPEVGDRTDLLTDMLTKVGYGYRLVTETQIHRGSYLENARYLLRRGRVRVPTRRRLELFAQIATAGCLPFGVFRADDDQTWIARMILDGLLSVPMDTALCPYSPVSVAIEGEGQPWVWALFN